MKRDAQGKAKSAVSLTDYMTGSTTTNHESKGRWDAEGDGQLWIYTTPSCQGRAKIAGFDMDSTLIVTKTGHVFPKDTADWKLIYETVPKKLKETYDSGYKLVIFSNQKGLTTGKVDKAGFKQKIERICAKIGCPMQVFLSLGDGEYRKPSTGMWQAMRKRNDDVEIDLAASFFVGDAAGRHKTKSRAKKDHSFADRFFAHNVGLAFHTPEQFFLGHKAQEPWGPPTFEPKELFKADRKQYEPDTRVPSEKHEIIVMCGFPGSGKSTFARKLADEHGYAVVNRDTLGTWQKCVAEAEKALKDGRSVVVDNTNPDPESRSRYIELAKRLKVPCRCFHVQTSLDHARHNVRFRSLTEKRKNEVNTMVLRMFEKKFKQPKEEEGFDQCVRVNPMPEFGSDDHKSLYMQYLIE